MAALEQGVFDFIREEYDLTQDEYVPRQYFSGGAVPGEVSRTLEQKNLVGHESEARPRPNSKTVTVDLARSPYVARLKTARQEHVKRIRRVIPGYSPQRSFYKAIRDRILEKIIANFDEIPVWMVIDDGGEWEDLLVQKLFEEFIELQQSLVEEGTVKDDTLIEEVSDLLEILDGINSAHENQWVGSDFTSYIRQRSDHFQTAALPDESTIIEHITDQIIAMSDEASSVSREESSRNLIDSLIQYVIVNYVDPEEVIQKKNSKKEAIGGFDRRLFYVGKLYDQMGWDSFNRIGEQAGEARFARSVVVNVAGQDKGKQTLYAGRMAEDSTADETFGNDVDGYTSGYAEKRIEKMIPKILGKQQEAFLSLLTQDKKGVVLKKMADMIEDQATRSPVATETDDGNIDTTIEINLAVDSIDNNLTGDEKLKQLLSLLFQAHPGVTRDYVMKDLFAKAGIIPRILSGEREKLLQALKGHPHGVASLDAARNVEVSLRWPFSKEVVASIVAASVAESTEEKSPDSRFVSAGTYNTETPLGELESTDIPFKVTFDMVEAKTLEEALDGYPEEEKEKIRAQYQQAVAWIKESEQIKSLTPPQLGRLVQNVIEYLTGNPDPHRKTDAQNAISFDQVCYRLRQEMQISALGKKARKGRLASNDWIELLGLAMVYRELAGATDITFFGVKRAVIPLAKILQVSMDDLDFSDQAATEKTLDRLAQKSGAPELFHEKDNIPVKIFKLMRKIVLDKGTRSARLEGFRGQFQRGINMGFAPAKGPVLILADDREDFEFDQLIIEILLLAGFDVQVAAKAAPIMNDMEEAWAQAKLEGNKNLKSFLESGRLTVLSTGTTTGGLDLNQTSSEFNDALAAAQAVIPQGSLNQGSIMQEGVRMPQILATKWKKDTGQVAFVYKESSLSSEETEPTRKGSAEDFLRNLIDRRKAPSEKLLRRLLSPQGVSFDEMVSFRVYSESTVKREIQTMVDLLLLTRAEGTKRSYRFTDMVAHLAGSRDNPDLEKIRKFIDQVINIEYPVGQKGPAKNRPLARGTPIPDEHVAAVRDEVLEIVQPAIPIAYDADLFSGKTLYVSADWSQTAASRYSPESMFDLIRKNSKYKKEMNELALEKIRRKVEFLYQEIYKANGEKKEETIREALLALRGGYNIKIVYEGQPYTYFIPPETEGHLAEQIALFARPIEKFYDALERVRSRVDFPNSPIVLTFISRGDQWWMEAYLKQEEVRRQLSDAGVKVVRIMASIPDKRIVGRKINEYVSPNLHQKIFFLGDDKEEPEFGDYAPDGTFINVEALDAAEARAQAAKVRERRASPEGGIDLHSDLFNLKIERDGAGVSLPAFRQPVELLHLDTLVPVIINIAPADIPALLGQLPEEPSLSFRR